MTSRKKKEPKASDANTLKIRAEPGKSREAMNATLAAMPTMTATMVAASFSRAFGEVDVTALNDALLDQTTGVLNGNMRGVESTLVAQAAALNSIFTDLALRSAVNMGEYMDAAETYMKLALRAQSQCRATLETLATIKNPPVVFAKQANIANNQQVNNGEAVPIARAGETRKTQSEQSRLTHDGQSLDFGTPAQASRGDPAMAAVEAIDRPAHQGRQGKIEP